MMMIIIVIIITITNIIIHIIISIIIINVISGITIMNIVIIISSSLVYVYSHGRHHAAVLQTGGSVDLLLRGGEPIYIYIYI